MTFKIDPAHITRGRRTGGAENIILAGGQLDGYLIEIPTHMQQKQFIDIPMDSAAKGLGLPDELVVGAPRILRYRRGEVVDIPEMRNPPRLYTFCHEATR